MDKVKFIRGNMKKRLNKKQREQRQAWKDELHELGKIEGKTLTQARRELWLKLKLYGKHQPKSVVKGFAATSTGVYVIRGYK